MLEAFIRQFFVKVSPFELFSWNNQIYPGSLGLVLFAKFQIIFGYFKGIDGSKSKNEVAFVIKPQKVKTFRDLIFPI